MYKYLLFAILCACAKDPIRTNSTNNPDIAVSLLFEHDGCKVYRFVDEGTYRYFTNCKGSTSWEESCGKNCTKEVGVE
jgi:hypothetical protein